MSWIQTAANAHARPKMDSAHAHAPVPVVVAGATPVHAHARHELVNDTVIDCSRSVLKEGAIQNTTRRCDLIS